MPKETTHTYMAYRCPECGEAVFGVLADFALAKGMLRLKCGCQKSSADITTVEADKIKLSLPCVLCRDNHTYTMTKSLLMERESFNLLCPYSNFEIGFFGTTEKIDESLKGGEEKLKKLLSDLELETLSDIQPEDIPECEALPDPRVYDTIRLVLKDLEDEGRVSCPCHGGPYDLRFTDSGIQAYCESCGAVYDFFCTSESAAERYLDLSELTLK